MSRAVHLSIHGRSIEITRRAFKRSMGLTLRMNGSIRVSAPMGLSITKIRDFVEAQDSWIKTNLEKYESVRASYPRKAIREGELFPFLGIDYPLTFEMAFETLSGTARPRFKIQNGQLVCQIRKDMCRGFDAAAPHPELIAGLIAFYKKKSREVLIDSVKEFSDRMGLAPAGLSFRGQKTRWGSCSSKGRISLNWKLIIAPLDVVNYVVVHELSHLKYYDHSKSFWSLVSTQVPDFLE